jgi:hypothetical protein
MRSNLSKERLYKAAKRYQTEDHWKKFKQYRAQVKAEIDKAHRKFIFDMLEVNGTMTIQVGYIWCSTVVYLWEVVKIIFREY